MLTDQFAQVIEAAGLVPPDTIHADGLLHRFSPTGKRSDNAAWYCLFGDGTPTGVFGCWRTGLTETWCAKPKNQLSTQERAELRQRVHQAKAQRDQVQAQRQQAAQQAARVRWDAAKPAHQHSYALVKGIAADGLRVDADGILLVPMLDAFGTLHSLQTIAPDGTKRFLAGGRVRGCFHAIGSLGKALVICEGVATGQSIHEATGLPVACAFSAGNLAAVARVLRQRYPHIALLVAADDDHATEGNPGLTAARTAAMTAGAVVVVPQFPADRPRKATDFNDLFSLAGAGAVRSCFAEVWEGLSDGL